jgi:membrane protein DedA with SNARE-associated domain
VLEILMAFFDLVKDLAAGGWPPDAAAASVTRFGVAGGLALYATAQVATALPAFLVGALILKDRMPKPDPAPIRVINRLAPKIGLVIIAFPRILPPPFPVILIDIMSGTLAIRVWQCVVGTAIGSVILGLLVIRMGAQAFPDPNLSILQVIFVLALPIVLGGVVFGVRKLLARDEAGKFLWLRLKPGRQTGGSHQPEKTASVAEAVRREKLTMTDVVTTATAYVHACNAKDVDAALTYLSDTIVMNSPMGPKNGKPAVGQILKMMVKMPGPPLADPSADGDGASTRLQTPMGLKKMLFAFDDGLISKIDFVDP